MVVSVRYGWLRRWAAGESVAESVKAEMVRGVTGVDVRVNVVDSVV